MRSRLVALLIVLGLAGLCSEAGARVYYSRAEALELAFPEADRVETRTVVLDDEQARAVESLARAPLESRLVRLFTGMRDEEVLGYAFIEIHTVRTLPEAFLIVVSPDGEIRSLRFLAFYEPEEYLPPERWLEQFDRRRLDPELRIGGVIHGIAGATLSARAVTGGVRRALALFEVLVGPTRRRVSSGERGPRDDVAATGGGR